MKQILTKEQRRLRDSNLKVVDIPLDKIMGNPFQSREKYGISEIKSLAMNISERGLLQPIVVAKTEKRYVLIAGHRRTRAFRKLHRKTIPGIVRLKTTTEDMIIDLAIENTQRKDLIPIEKARTILDVLSRIKAIKHNIQKAYALVSQVKLYSKRGDSTEYNTKGNCTGFTMDDIFGCKRLLELIGISPNSCITHLRLLTLPKNIQDKIVTINDNHKQQAEALEQGKIPIVLGYELSRVNSRKVQRELYNRVIKKKLSSVVVRGIVDEMLEHEEVDQYNQLGTSRKRSSEDYGLNKLIDDINDFASRLWNFRTKYPKINIALGRLLFKASLRRLKKSSEGLIESMESYFNDVRNWKIKNYSNRDIEVTVRPGTGGQKFRFTFPGKYGEKLGLDTGDVIVFNIKSIKKRRKQFETKKKIICNDDELAVDFFQARRIVAET